MAFGTITKWIESKQTGFIRPDELGEDLYFTANSLCDHDTALWPAAGMRVQYRPGVNPRGPTSYHVRLLPRDAGNRMTA